MSKPTDLDPKSIDQLATALWSQIVGAGLLPHEQNLRAKLALEQKILRHSQAPFGLDRLSTDEAAAYAGLASETLRQTSKRRALHLPQPYAIGRRLFWRRSELDVWIESQRHTNSRDTTDQPNAYPKGKRSPTRGRTAAAGER
jgi:predicted DNA-binding transcriptional regulator AlpA